MGVVVFYAIVIGFVTFVNEVSEKMWLQTLSAVLAALFVLGIGALICYH
jgi:hypothetical protein